MNEDNRNIYSLFLNSQFVNYNLRFTKSGQNDILPRLLLPE